MLFDAKLRLTDSYSMLSVLRFLLVPVRCFMLTVFLCATVWYYLDVLICVSVYINFYFLSFSFLFILFS